MKSVRNALVGLLAGLTALSLAPGTEPAGAAPASAPQPRRVMSQMPTPFGSTMQNSDGSFTVRLSTGPVNAVSEDGSLRPIDTRLKSVSGSEYAAVARGHAFTAKVPRNPRRTPIKLVRGDAWVSLRLHGAGRATPSISGSTAVVEGAGNTGRLTYDVVSTGIKETIRLTRPPIGALTYTYTLDASPGLSPKPAADGSIELVSRAGQTLFTIPGGTMVDSAEQPSESTDVPYSLRRTGAGWQLTVTPDRSWLTDPARVYPVSIDPSISTLPSRDCWLNQAAPTNHYCGDPSSYIRVGRQDTSTASRRRGLVDFDVSSIPANAQVTRASAWLYLDSSQTPTSASAEYAVYEPGKAFGTASWDDSGGNGSWNGGNPRSTVYARKNMDGQTSGYKPFYGLGDLVQGWVDGSSPRRGILLKQVEENVANTMWFYSSSASSSNNGKRPYLEVTYTLPPLPPDPFDETEGAQTETAPTTVFDSAADGQVPAGSTRIVPIAIPDVAIADVDRVVAVVQVLDWTASGSVSVFGADEEPPATPTLSFDATETAGKVKSAVVELEPSVASDPGSIAISATGSGSPRIVVLARGWYGWASEDVTDDAPDLLTAAESDDVMAVSEAASAEAEPEDYLLDVFGRSQGLIEPDPAAVDDCVTTQPPGGSTPACAEQYSLAGDPTEAVPDTEPAMVAAAAQLHCSKEGPAWKIKTRTYGCRKTGLAWQVGDGVVGFKVTEAIETDTRGRLVKHHWQVRMKQNTSQVDWFEVTVTTNCRRGCSGAVANASSTELFGLGEDPLGAKHVATATGDIGARTSSSDKGHIQPVSLFLRVKIEWLGQFSSRKRMKNTPYIRCDNIKYLNAGYGCVLPAGRVALDLYPPGDGTGESAELIADAQAGMYGHPGDPDATNKYGLSRLHDASDRRSNRRVARAKCRLRTKPAGTSCDEYPFASTYQGCATTTVTTGVACYARWVNAAHNSKAGSLLGRFYQTWRILDTNQHVKMDRFYVRVN